MRIAVGGSVALYVLVLIGLIAGWVMNIVKVIGLNFDAITGEHVIRIAGIFIAPVGGVAGYF